MRNCLEIVLAAVLIASAPATVLAQQPASQPPPQPGQLPPGQPAVTTRLPDTITATPLTTREKFSYRVIQSFGLRGFVGSAFAAGIAQWDDSPHAWGQGAEGYGLRYGSAFGSNLVRQSFAWGVESALHDDPRYFPSIDKQSGKRRFANAIKQVFLTKRDSGHDQFAYARFISAFGAGQFVNVWQPKDNNSFTDGLERGVISIGADAAYNLLQEFVPFTRPSSLRHNKPGAPTTP